MIEAVARAEAAVARMEQEHRELQKSASKSDRVVRDLLAEADEQAATVSVPPGSETPSSLPDAHAATTVPSANDSVTLETMMNGELHFSPRKIARVGEFLGAAELRANLVSQKIIDLGEKGAAEEAAAEAEQQQQSQLQQPTAKLQQQPPPKEDFSHVTEEYLQSLLMQSPTQAQDLIERMAAASSVGLISSPKAPTGAFPYNP